MEKRTVDVVVISDVQLRDMWSHSPTSEKNNRNRKGKSYLPQLRRLGRAYDHT